MNQGRDMILELENGMIFKGYSFGHPSVAAGEAVFNTAMNGYPESLTDPSYRGQLLIATFPLVGNYGVPNDEPKDQLSAFFESERIHISGLVIANYSAEYSHWNAGRSLGDWLKANKIPGIYGVDTRAITKIIRETGAMKARIVLPNESTPFVDPNERNLVAEVSIKHKTIHGTGKYRVLLVDTGVKHNILRCLLKRDTTIIRVPWDYDYSEEEYDGVFLTNGPGDPQQCVATITQVKEALRKQTPIFGICLGSQIMALASGATTYKLKYGHRGYNQPVQMLGTQKCYITSQNHGYAIDTATLSNDWAPLFVNINDGSCEGIYHKSKPFFAVQFHPEAAGGPADTDFLFDHFMHCIQNPGILPYESLIKR